MLRKLIDRWRVWRLLRALRIVANSKMCQQNHVVVFFSINNRGVLITSGDVEPLRDVVRASL